MNEHDRIYSEILNICKKEIDKNKIPTCEIVNILKEIKMELSIGKPTEVTS